jgi:hypothetical protein
LFDNETRGCFRFARSVQWFLGACASSTDERGARAATVGERRSEAAKAAEEDGQAAGESTEESREGAEEAAAGSAQSRRQGKSAAPSVGAGIPSPCGLPRASLQWVRFALISAVIWRVGSDTGSRGSSPLDFAEKTGFLLTFLHVELTTMQTSQNFDNLFFAHLKVEFNPHF